MGESMNDNLLSRLAAAQSQEERTWITTESLLSTLSPDLRSAAWAAAIPQWFNAEFLAALRPELSGRLPELYYELQKLPFVEPFPSRGHNIHELTRKAMLDHLWLENREEYTILSTRAAEFLAARHETQTQIEQLYTVMLKHYSTAGDRLGEAKVVKAIVEILVCGVFC